jgi:SAM-dependent methyltransferase
MASESWERYWALQAKLAPGLRYSQVIYEDLLRTLPQRRGCWLDLGCGHQLLPSWRRDEERRLIAEARSIVGLDGDRASLAKHATIRARVHSDAARLPFAAGSFDLVTSNMVFEHLETPAATLREIGRVLRPGGCLLVHTPNAASYATLPARLLPQGLKNRLIESLQGRAEEDVFPACYRVNSPRLLRELGAAAGMQVAEMRMVCSQAVFAKFPVLAFFELLLIRALMTKPMRRFRTNILAVLTKV